MSTPLMMGGPLPPDDNGLDTPSRHMQRQANPYRMLTQESVKSLPATVLNIWGGEEKLVRGLPKAHPAHDFVTRNFGEPADMELIKKVIDGNPGKVVLMVPVLYCEDDAGHELRQADLEPRGEDVRSLPQIENALLVKVPQLALMHRPAGLNYTERPGQAILHASPARNRLESKLLTQMRRVQHEQEALAAFDTLFRHMSLNEELWRLEQLMDHCLPYTLEEHPKMAEYRALLKKQIGHLDNETDWYADGSPTAGFGVEYVKNALRLDGTPIRVTWMMNEAKKHGFKRVAEFGSVEGVNLFYYVQQCPEVEWTGFEASAKAVARGHALAKEGGLTGFKLEQMERGGKIPAAHQHQYDAVALFEVLEHNRGPTQFEVLRAAASLVKPGGWIYMTTPWGNWSLFDEHTQDINLPKDHICAMTERRTWKLLRESELFEPDSIQVEKIENPSYHECNAWVFSYGRLRKPK